jgi:hypothetical protein
MFATIAQAQTDLEAAKAARQQSEAHLISTVNGLNCRVFLRTFGTDTPDQDLADMAWTEPSVFAVLQQTAQGRCHKEKGAAEFSARLVLALATAAKKTRDPLAAQPANVPAAVSKPSQISRPTPFGFKPGMTREQIVAAVGTSHVLLDRGTALSLNTAPTPNSNFERYVVLVSTSVAGLGKVEAIVTVPANRSGEQVIEKYSGIKAALTEKYGKPERDFNFVHAGALFSEPSEFMMSLLKGERSLASSWHLDDGTLIFLRAEGADSQSASVKLGYEFHPEFDAYEKEKGKEEQSTY